MMNYLFATSFFRKFLFSSNSVGHKGIYGHEFLEFEFRPDGRLRYANNSNYKSDVLIRKEVYCNDIILKELKRIIEDSEILKLFFYENKNFINNKREDDTNWPTPDKIGR